MTTVDNSTYYPPTSAPTAKRRALAYLLEPEALKGLFGFGVPSIALAQASQWLFIFHLNTFEQLGAGLAGGTLGALLGAFAGRTDD